jgi:hypothetical protein
MIIINFVGRQRQSLSSSSTHPVLHHAVTIIADVVTRCVIAIIFDFVC